MIDWERTRRVDGSIDLVAAYELRYGPAGTTAENYLKEVEALRPQLSRQCAAVAVVNARWWLLAIRSS